MPQVFSRPGAARKLKASLKYGMWLLSGCVAGDEKLWSPETPPRMEVSWTRRVPRAELSVSCRSPILRWLHIRLSSFFSSYLSNKMRPWVKRCRVENGIQWGEKTFLLCYFDHKSAGLTESSCCHPVSENLSRDGMNMNKGTHVCVHIYTQVHTHTHICTDIHKHTDTPTNTSHTHVHIHMCTHMRTHKHTHHTRIYTHTCMYTYTHACMYTQPSLCIYVFLYYTVPQISTFTALVIFHGFRMSFSIDAP